MTMVVVMFETALLLKYFNPTTGCKVQWRTQNFSKGRVLGCYDDKYGVKDTISLGGLGACSLEKKFIVIPLKITIFRHSRATFHYIFKIKVSQNF